MFEFTDEELQLLCSMMRYLKSHYQEERETALFTPDAFYAKRLSLCDKILKVIGSLTTLKKESRK